MNDLTFKRTSPGERPLAAEADGIGAGDGARREALALVPRYLRVVKRWKWLIIGAVAVCLALGLLATALMTRLYTASATLEIQRENYRIVNVEGVEPEASAVDLEFYQTQYGLLQSRSLAERVALEAGVDFVLHVRRVLEDLETFGRQRVEDKDVRHEDQRT